jgi:CRP-like cAMP-binding protein
MALASTVAVTPLVVADATAISQPLINGEYPGLAKALSLAARQHEGWWVDHMVRLGRQKGCERMVHFLLELRRRLSAVGIGQPQRFPMPLTQEVLADAIGVTAVHVNRILQQLRAERLIELAAGELTLRDPVRLNAIAG